MAKLKAEKLALSQWNDQLRGSIEEVRAEKQAVADEKRTISEELAATKE